KSMFLNGSTTAAMSDSYAILMDPVSAQTTNRLFTHQSSIGGTTTVSAYRYDVRGNVLVGGGRVAAIDGRNRVIELRAQEDTERELVRYAYDAASMRVRKHDRDRDLVTYYVRDSGGRLMSEFRLTQRGTSTPEWTKHYLYLGDRLIGLRENRVPPPPSG